ncbi:MAG TPA: zinc-binding alcohol dehydrogenase family protein [Solirubrobacteraceae bacterium]|nr:zinc-binding alcohol dehydrogenase family protein [Solirubrobacteraceae bacterium]
MKAAVLPELGVPEYGEFPAPSPNGGQAVVQVGAAGLNPVDIAIAAGVFYAGVPPVPSVAGREGVGVLDGTRVYFDAPIPPYGSMAELALIDPAAAYPLPDALDDGVAIALGIAGLAAWLALDWRARMKAGEHVVVLGASGVLGQIAVQAARHLGAGRVVAAARSQDGLELARALGADATVGIGEPGELASALRDAADGRIDVVVDPLFGEPLAAAAEAASFRARLVTLGTSAGQTSTLSSAAIRGKMLDILGHSNVYAPPEVKREAYLRMAELAVAGGLRVEVERIPLAEVRAAWERLAASPHRKLVLVP